MRNSTAIVRYALFYTLGFVKELLIPARHIRENVWEDTSDDTRIRSLLSKILRIT